MSFANRIVIDTSTLIGALLKPRSVPRQAFNHALATGTLCVLPATLAKLENVLLRDKFDRYLDRESHLGFLQLYHAATAHVPVTLAEENNLTPPCRDSRDNKFLALALHCSAHTVISSDEDLLILNPWHEITLVSPAQFLS
jgi:putative PIN family toxin of toxin-antitoxin system